MADARVLGPGNWKSDMPLYIKNERVDRLARQVAEVADESLTLAVLTALEERLERLEGRRHTVSLKEEILAIRARCKALPVLNCSDPASVLGYDDQGLPR